ncbi:hypothetical protein ACFQ8C_12225 [Streptomyces sp. NPDC056503]|uniref:hypothetical protein n=1 Tax=Streptomyces sp. NPDC056503 TaxID=3345842 RepID=UPI0036CF3113
MSKQRVEMRHRQPTGTDDPEIRTPEPGGEPPEPGPGAKRKIDLSVPQVAGSAVAAVIAAKLASTLGVYGTILGAGVISVIATCGGPLFQQLFKHTGEQVRDATVAAKPKARQVPLAAPGHAPAGDRHTLMLGTVPEAAAPFPYDEEFGSATTHGTRLRGWKRPVLAAALVFGVTMGGITTYELVSGEDFSGTKGTTTFGSVVRGGGGQRDAPEQPGQERERQPRTPAPTGSASPDAGPDAGTPSGGATPAPGTGTGTPSDGATTAPAPDPTGSADDGTDPTEEPAEPTAEPTAPGTPTAPTGDPGTGPASGDAAPTAPSGDPTG